MILPIMSPSTYESSPILYLIVNNHKAAISVYQWKIPVRPTGLGSWFETIVPMIHHRQKTMYRFFVTLLTEFDFFTIFSPFDTDPPHTPIQGLPIDIDKSILQK